jgi:Ca-activated chloride channel family protein
MAVKNRAILWFVSALWLFPFSSHAADESKFRPEIIRILFILDGSGSMREKWGETEKWDIARELLYKLADSIGKQHPYVEFGVRVFGHQFPREQKNCKDSRLEVPFGKANAENIKKILAGIVPKGQTPIAWSVEQSAADFPKSDKSINSILLITDGLENCEGDPCQAAAALQEKRITLKPFIVGIGNDVNLKTKLSCAGTFFSATDKQQFEQAIGVIIRQTLNTTTAQVSLLDEKGEPTVTNIPFTLYDHLSKKPLYQFVHALNSKGFPDTLYLDPVGKYDLEVHTTPSVLKENIELTTGIHNIIAADVPVGEFKFNTQPAGKIRPSLRSLVYSAPSGRKAMVLGDAGARVALLKNQYNILHTSTPCFIEEKVDLPAGRITELYFPLPGTLLYKAVAAEVVSVIMEGKQIHQRVYLEELSAGVQIQVPLLPGNYILIRRSQKSSSTVETRSIPFKVESGKETLINP